MWPIANRFLTPSAVEIRKALAAPAGISACNAIMHQRQEKFRRSGARDASVRSHGHHRKVGGGRPSESEIEKETQMNWDQIEGKWKQVKGQARQKWGNLTDDDVDRIDGKREELVGQIQESYGIAREEAEKQVEEFEESLTLQTN